MTCIVHEDVCAACGESVKGGSSDGQLNIPVGGQRVVCLTCLCLCIEEKESDEP